MSGSGGGEGIRESAVRKGTSSFRPDRMAWLKGCSRNKRSKGFKLATEAVKTMRLIDGVVSAASSTALLPASAWETRSPGWMASGEATWIM